MKLGELYNIVVKEGSKQDPRTKEEIFGYLKSVKQEYENLLKQEKEVFDKERFKSPYDDTRIVYGNINKQIRTAMVGIDIETPELMLAKSLSSKKSKIDLVISHHPIGLAKAEFYKVMTVIYDVLEDSGVKGAKIKKMLGERMQEVARRIHSANCSRIYDAARLLDMPVMCTHTVADNFVYQYFRNMIDMKKPEKISDLMNMLYDIPEYKIATKLKQGPKIILGNRSSKCGKVLIEMTGGTEGPKDIYKELAKNNVNTLLCMHLSEEHFKKAKKHKFNIIIAGHISSDNLGMNLLLDKVQKYGKLNIKTFSGFVRIPAALRNKGKK